MERQPKPTLKQTVNCHSHHIIAPSLWVYIQSKSLFQKMKASHSFHVTLASASGVSKYHTGPLIASILLYLKILQYAQPADIQAFKGLGR